MSHPEIKSRGLIGFICLMLVLVSVEASTQTMPTAKDHVKRGFQLLKAGELDAALEQANLAIELNSSLVSAYQLRYEVNKQKDPEGYYVDDCDMVIKLAPSAASTAFYYLCRGNFRAHKLNWDGANDDMTKAIQLDPDNGGYYNFRAFIHLFRNDLVQARADYEKSLSIKATLPSPYLRRAYWFYISNHFADAADDLSRAIEWKSDYAEAYASRAFVRGLQGNIEQAIHDLKKAASLNFRAITDHIPEDSFGAPFAELNMYIKYHAGNARGYLMRGMFNLYQNKEDAAARDFQRALELQPSLKAEIDEIRVRIRTK